MINSIVSFLENWIGSIVPMAGVSLGILILVSVVYYCWDNKLKIFGVSDDICGTKVASLLVIVLSCSAVLYVGLSTPQAMIGDEVTHFYMLEKQSKDLSVPNFYAEIPIGDNSLDIRGYPHPFIWHYIGGFIYKTFGNSFKSIQVYQTMFFAQFLFVGYLLAKSWGGLKTKSALIYVLVLASIPMCLLFSVAFYQDIPMTAQVLTAFLFLRRERWLLATLFMAFALCLKVTAILFYPSFVLLFVFFVSRKSSWMKSVSICFCSLLILTAVLFAMSHAITTYGNSTFYPVLKAEQLVKQIKTRFVGLDSKLGVHSQTRVSEKPSRSTLPTVEKRKRVKKLPIIANHPGDLRSTVNYLVYGGVVVLLVIILGVVGLAFSLFRPKEKQATSDLWFLMVGLLYIVPTAYLLKSSPDARFFLPGLPFILLPIVEKVVNLPKLKPIIVVISTLAVLQSGLVLAKAHKLRVLDDGIIEGIEYVKAHPPQPKRLFMYPEGNYRFFSADHEWYFGYRLRQFWRGDNDFRINMLQRFKVGAVVIKKHLIANVDKEITNLGVYPVDFVKEISEDSRFKKELDNESLMIFKVPQKQ